MNNYIQCGWRRAWIMWDLSNGSARNKRDNGKGYVWIFQNKKQAVEHRSKQHKMQFGAKLSKPIKIEYKDREP